VSPQFVLFAKPGTSFTCSGHSSFTYFGGGAVSCLFQFGSPGVWKMKGRDTDRQGIVPFECQQRTIREVWYGRMEAHSETQPSWWLPTSV